MVRISHVVGVFSRHMTKPRQEHGNGCFKHISTSITYSGCGDLVCVYMIYEISISASVYQTGYLWRQNGRSWTESCRHVHVRILLEKLWSSDCVWLVLVCRKGDELIKGMIYQVNCCQGHMHMNATMLSKFPHAVTCTCMKLC